MNVSPSVQPVVIQISPEAKIVTDARRLLVKAMRQSR